MLKGKGGCVMDQQKIGSFIALLRKEQGLSQQELAQRLHVTNKAVSKWETGRSLPDGAIMGPLASYLGITVDELLAGERRLPPGVEKIRESRGPGLSQLEIRQIQAQAAVRESRIWKGRIMLWIGVLLLLGQCIYLLRHTHAAFWNVDAFNAVTEEEVGAVVRTMVFPGVTLLHSAHGTTVMFTWLWGWFLSGWPGAILLPLSIALLTAGAAVKRRAKRQLPASAKRG